MTGPDLERWRELHGGAAPTGLVGGWLRFVYAIAGPLARRRVPPDLITLAGLAVAGVALWPAGAGGRWPLAAAALIAGSAVLDGLDGAVAVLNQQVSGWGAVLDAVVDRFAECCFMAALWLAGAPAGWCVAAAVLALGHEQLRASARSEGMREVGVVTVSERPTRVIVSAAFLLAAGIYPSAGATWATIGAIVGAVVGLAGFAQVLIVVRRRLR